MTDLSESQESFRYTSNRGWWTPTLLLLLLLPKQVHSSQPKWWIIDAVIFVVLLAILYVMTHPTLTFSPVSITQQRGPFRTTIDLKHLQTVRIDTVQRRTNVMDPQTGERRSVIRWNYKNPDDWAGKPPVQGFYMQDCEDHHLSLSVLRTKPGVWCAHLLRAIKEQTEVEIGPRVVEALESFVR